MLIELKRILKAGILNFYRQGNLSFATILVLVITISLITFLFISHKILNFTISEIKNRADISVYFHQDCPETEIFKIKEKLAEFEGVQEIEYVSKEEALANFIERHKKDKVIMDSLAELGFNPFLASLNIKAPEMSLYERVTEFLSGDEFSNLIEKIDYQKRKPIIERVFAITTFVDKVGMIVSGVLISVSVLLAFNTIKLTIFSQREEISIMKLVGASNWFVRGPFLVQGAICGLLAFLLSFLIVWTTFYFLNSKISIFFPSFTIFHFFQANFQNIILIQLISALFLGIVPSFIAIRRYLEV